VKRIFIYIPMYGVRRRNLIYTEHIRIYIYRYVIRSLVSVWMVLRKRQDFDNPRGSWFISYKEAKARRHIPTEYYMHNNNNIMLPSYYILFFDVWYVTTFTIICLFLLLQKKRINTYGVCVCVCVCSAAAPLPRAR